MYDWGPHSAFSVLLLHNAMAVIVTVILCQLIRQRLVIALTATALCILATFWLRDSSISHRVGWWGMMQDPLDGWHDELESRVRLTYTLLAGGFAPFVFSLLTTWRWANGPKRKPIRLQQLRMRSILEITTLACLSFGFYHWIDSHSISYLPMIFAAIILMLRPDIVFRDWRIRQAHRVRLQEARRRWRHAP